MADTLVERLTGQAAADQINTEINLIMPIDALIKPGDPTPAEIPGYGPIPGWLARQLAVSHGPARRWWRRLFTAPSPDGGAMIVGGDPTRRRFDGWLGKLITLRDQTCREPYCTAPIRHLDHVTPYRDGGLTTYSNGRGALRTTQLHPRNARLAARTPQQPTPHHHHHHPHRTQLPQPRPQPTLTAAPPQSGRNSTADAVGVPVKLPDQPKPVKVMACAAGSSLVMVKPAAGRVARR